MSRPAFDNFIESWGAMGVLWGINRSMARIHALIMLSNEAIDLDSVSRKLNISRGNASMCLKELRNWGVIQRVHVSGDRRDFYISEQDAWKMFFRIAFERKKREFDPAFAALRHFLSEADLDESSQVYERLQEMEDLLSRLNRIMGKFLEDENSSKTMLSFVSNFVPEKSKQE